MDLLELLKAGDVEGFNEARAGQQRPDLFAAELAGIKLHGADLQGANLDKSDLTGTDLTDANLVLAFLSDIDGSDMILDGVLAMRARLKDAWLENADLTGADFSRGDLSGAVLSGTKGEGMRLVATRMKDANAKGAVWPLADLTEASFKRTDFTGADLSRVKMTEGRGGGAILTGARLDGADAAGVKLGGAVMVGASLKGARLPQASLAGADLSNANLQHADLTGANLAGANLTGANLEGAILIDACLDDCVLTDALMEGADLTGVDAQALGLTSAQLEGLTAFGAPFDPDAPLSFSEAEVAVSKGLAAALWVNPDSDDTASLRFAVKKGTVTLDSGVLPISVPSVLAHNIVALGDSFLLVVVARRAAGHALLGWTLHRDGKVSDPTSLALPFEPAVLPVIRVVDGSVRVWFLGRRGPTVWRIKGTQAGFEVIDQREHSTARGFLGKAHPILACKGGVVTAVEGEGAGRPLRTPDGFPSRVCAAVPLGDKVMAVWPVAPLPPREPGGLRWQWLGDRSAREPEDVTKQSSITSIDGVVHEGGVLLAWTEDRGFGEGNAYIRLLPDGDVKTVHFAKEPVESVVIVLGTDGKPRLAATTFAGRLLVSSLKGKIEAIFSDAG